MSSGSLTDALRETLALFEESGPPLTTNEVAERLDLGRRSTYDRLERLVDRGALETKKVGANARVWWRTGETSGAYFAEGGLDTRSDQLTLLVEAVGEYAIFMLDADGRVQTWNRGAERIKGYDRGEIIGEHFSTFYTEEDRDAGGPEGNLADARADGVATDEGWRLRADGSTFWAHVTITAIYDESGDLAGYAKVTRDMTERRDQERTIRRERNLLDQVLETSPIGIGVFRRDAAVDRMNARMTELLGLADDDVGADSLCDRGLVDGDGDPLTLSNSPVGRVLETGGPVTDEEVRIEDEARGTRWLSVDAAPLSAGDDEPDRIIVTARDVTEQREQAQRLERQRDELVSELEEMYERIDDAFLALDDNWQVTFVNDRAAEMVGLSAGDLLGTRVWDSLPEVAEGYPRERAEEAMETQESTEFEFHSEMLDIWVEVRLYPSETGLSVYFRDVTERKERERKLQRYETIVETMVDGVFVTDEGGRYAMVNDAYVDMTGYSRDELIGSDTSLVIGEENAEEGRAMTEEILEGERRVGVWELTQQRADGGTNQVESRFTLLPNDGGYRGSVGVIRDVSERKERERELEQYETIIESVNEGVYVVDEDMNFQWVNEAYAEMLGYSREELIGENASMVVDSEVLREADAVAEVEGYDSLPRMNVELWTKDGDRVLVEAAANVLPEGEKDGWFQAGVVRDVTERKERELELERYERIVETVNDGVYLVSPEGEFTMVNEAYAEMTGYPPEELVGMSVDEIVDQETVERALGYEREMVEGERETARFEADVLTADGGSFRGEGVFSIIEDDEGEHVRVGVVRDVTERKERERELAEQRERYRGLVESAPVGIATYDAEGRLAFVNDVASELVGADDPEELAGEPAIEFIHPDDRTQAAERMRRVVEEREPAPPRETKIVGLDGDVSYAMLASAPITREGEPGGQVALSDVTKRKEYERELELQRNHLEALNDLNEVVHSITDAVIDQSTREEIERAVCSGLADAESYEFAWIGEVDPTTQTMRLRTEAGVEGYLDDATVSVDPDDPRGQGPTGRAVRTQRMQTSDDAFEDATYEEWREQARELGFRSSAAVPLVHEDVRYGVLNVYADRPSAFTGDESEVVEHLGEIVGHAIAAVERKRALTSDEVVELAFRIQGVFDAFDLPEGDGRITLDRAVPVGDGNYLEYGTATEDMFDVLQELVGTLPHWESVRVLGEPTDEGRVRFELELDDPPVLSAVTALGGYVDRAVIEDGDYHMRIHLAPSADARSLIELVQETYPMAQLVSRQQVTREGESPMPLVGMLEEHLTERQRSALEAAYFAGYFEWPRDVNGEDVADSLGVSAPTFHQHLRKAQQKFLRVALDHEAAD